MEKIIIKYDVKASPEEVSGYAKVFFGSSDFTKCEKEDSELAIIFEGEGLHLKYEQKVYLFKREYFNQFF